MTQNVAYLDCAAGISAEMLLGALLDAGLALDTLQGMLAALPIQGYQLKYEAVRAHGMRGSCLAILTSSVQPGLALKDAATLLQASTLAARVQETSLLIFRRLEEAFLAVSGTSSNDQYLSETEVVKALICVVGVVLGIEALAITQLFASPLPLTTGYGETVQGHQAAPLPVTLAILRHVEAPWKPSILAGEPVTAIAAALLATLARFEDPTLTIARVGYGFSGVSASAASCLRLYLGHVQLRQEAVQSPAFMRIEEADTDWVAVIETHIDTMTGELLGGLMERLFAIGALDVSYMPLQMKKNRPATLVTVICPLEEGERFALVLLRETSTLGVRIQRVQRLKAQREQRSIATPFGPAIVKIKRLGTQVISVAPEYEECRRIARVQNVSLAAAYDIVNQAIKNAMI